MVSFQEDIAYLKEQSGFCDHYRSFEDEDEAWARIEARISELESERWKDLCLEACSLRDEYHNRATELELNWKDAEAQLNETESRLNLENKTLRERIMELENELSRWHKSFDGHVYVTNEKYAELGSLLREAMTLVPKPLAKRILEALNY